jgi:hypothetical protein
VEVISIFNPIGWDDTNDTVGTTGLKKTSFKSVEQILKTEKTKEPIPSQHSGMSHYQSYWDVENTKKLQNSTLSRYTII